MDVVTIGETMVLFTPVNNGPIRYAQQWTRSFGGAESNFAIGLSRLGHKAGWISRIGDDEFGRSLLTFVRGEGVDVSKVTIDENAQTGVFFKEVKTEDDISVYYYRHNSAASKMSAELANEEYIKEAKYLHITGITPALSESCYELIKRSIEIAKRNNVTVVFDPNLRRKLWSEEKARKTLLELASSADIFLPGVSEAEFMLGKKTIDELGKQLLELGPSVVIIKIGEKGAYYFTKNEIKHVPGFPVKNVVDPVGAGDGFAAGFVSGLLDCLSIKEAVSRGCLVGAYVTQFRGDVEGLPSKKELEKYQNEASDDVSR